MNGEGPQDHAGPVVGERPRPIRLPTGFHVLAGQAVLSRPVELVGDHGDGPAAIVLPNGKQPPEPPLNARIGGITGLDEQRQERPGVVGSELVRQDAADIALSGLAGEEGFRRLLGRRVAPGQSVLLHQEPEVPPGLDQAVVDGLVLVLSRPRPASIRLLLFQDL